ncbi:MAG: hypothetical protein RLZ98_3336 [Pseudomonadota bacterium]|jgi:pimeloyl-ACP methyl ester carboxylesterase
MHNYLAIGGGRRLAYDVQGVSDGRPVIALHGTPGAGRRFANSDDIARRLGIRLIAPDRWGYGASGVPAVPTLAAFGHDMRLLVDDLGLEQVSLYGVSGGGPYAVAAAAALGDRVRKLALAGPVGDASDKSGFSLLHRFCFGPLTRMPGLVAASFGAFRVALRVAPGPALRVASIAGPQADRQVLLDPVVRRRLAETYRIGLQHGVAGPVLDFRLFGAGLGDLPERVSCTCRMWLGSADRNVPQKAAQQLALRLPACEVVTLEGQGHFWTLRDYEHVFGWLSES